MLSKIVFGIALIVISTLGAIRFSPVRVYDWTGPNFADLAIGDYPGEKSFAVVRQVGGPDIIPALRSVVLATPRTKEISTEDMEWMTVITRSKWLGFPDFTSARVRRADDGYLLEVYGRSQYGKLDLGVNKARIQGWLDQLGLLTPDG